MNFLIDAQLPYRLASWLRSRGHDVTHTTELPRSNRTPDKLLLAKANEEMRTVITKDADFLISFELGQGPPKLLLVATGNIHNDELLELFAKHEGKINDLLDHHSFIELGRAELVVHR